jgi:hypothetical protein
VIVRAPIVLRLKKDAGAESNVDEERFQRNFPA